MVINRSVPITLGCDPEIFVRNTKTTGQFQCISAHDLGIIGTKHEPEYSTGGMLQVDGMALEFAIYPCDTLKQWLDNIKQSMKVLEETIKKKNPSLVFHIEPVAHFTQTYIRSLPQEVTKLGCEPDYNAYTGKMNPSPDAEKPFRTGSGHIHIGWTENQDPHSKAHFYDCCEVVKQLDTTLGNLAPLWDSDRLRRELYGQRGAFRPKPYGVEYRVLSNKWLKSKALQGFIFQATMRSMQLLEEGHTLFNRDFLHTSAPQYTHRYLAREWDYPVVPGYSPSIVKDPAINPLDVKHMRQFEELNKVVHH